MLSRLFDIVESPLTARSINNKTPHDDYLCCDNASSITSDVSELDESDVRSVRQAVRLTYEYYASDNKDTNADDYARGPEK